MNKNIALFLVLAAFSSAALFAAPVSGAVREPQAEEAFEVDAFFADIDVTPVLDIDAQTVESDGLVGLTIGATIGVIVGGFIGGLIGKAIQKSAINNREKAGRLDAGITVPAQK